MVRLDLPAGLELRPFQVEDLEAWCTLPRPRTIWNCNGLSLGKTIDGIVCGKACQYDRILIVAAKSMRPEWEAELLRWWPEREAPAEIDKGFARKAMSQPEHFRLQAKLENRTHIVSPELLPKLVELHKQEHAERPEYRTLFPYDYVIIDEFHEHRSWQSKVMQAFRWLREAYPQADWKPLSGTPMGSDPLKAWPWLKLSEPSKWGNLRKGESIPFAFRQMYGEKVPSEYAFSGYTYEGVNMERLPLFKKSVAHLIRRRTAAEVGLQLPAMRFELKRHPMDISPEDAAADWAMMAVQQEPVMLLSHHHAPMDAIQAVLEARGAPFVRLYEEQSRNERVALVGQALARKEIILSTTGLVSTGVNYLADVRTWMLAEPTENPIEIQQLAGRFRRLSSKDNLPRVGYLLYREGEEFAAQLTLAKRLKVDKELVLPSADTLELERIIEGRSNASFMDTLKLLGRSLLAHGTNEDDDDGYDEAA